MTSKLRSVLNLTVLVAALGYFVDIYDLVLFGIVRQASLAGIGITDPGEILRTGEFLISLQMYGMLAGGLLWGVWGDKRGRLSVLFGSIALYSLGNLLNAFVTTVPQYAVLRFITGFGLAGELGAAITLVSEVLPKETRGYGTAVVAGVGVSGAILANLIAKVDAATWARLTFGVADLQPWQWTYLTGGVLGLLLLALRVGVAESGMFRKHEASTVARGDLRMLFNDRGRFLRFVQCLLIGLPIWFVAGILVNFAPETARGLGVAGRVSAGDAVALFYTGLILGDLGSGVLSQLLHSRRRVVALSLALTSLGIVAYVFWPGLTPRGVYGLCVLLGLTTGYWAVFVTVASEHFGTNLRATVTTVVPNVVRGALPLMILAYAPLREVAGVRTGVLVVGGAVMALAFLALRGLEETHGRDLDFVE